MDMPQHIANDNDRISTRQNLWASLSQRRTVRSHTVRKSVPFGNADKNPQFARPTIKSIDEKTSTLVLPAVKFADRISANMMILCLWIASLALLFYARDWNVPVSTKIGSGILASWTSLFLIFVNRRQNRPMFRTLGVLGLLSSLSAVGYFLATGYNIAGQSSLLLLGGAFTTAIIAAVIEEKFPLIISALLTLGWTGLSFSNLEFQHLSWLLPALFSLQFYAVSKLTSITALFLTGTTFYLWLGTSLYMLVYNGFITETMAVGALIAFGILHEMIGKNLQDVIGFGGLFHANVGWIVAIAAILTFQYHLLTDQQLLLVLAPDGAIAASGPFVWVCAMTLLVMAIIMAGIYRAKRQKRTYSAPLLIATLLTAMAFYIVAPIVVDNWLSPLTDKPALFIALSSGGLITAMALAKAFNGARRSISVMIIIGLAALSAQIALLSNYIMTSAENASVFGFSALIFTLLFASTAYKNSMPAQSRLNHYVSA